MGRPVNFSPEILIFQRSLEGVATVATGTKQTGHMKNVGGVPRGQHVVATFQLSQQKRMKYLVAQLLNVWYIYPHLPP